MLFAAGIAREFIIYALLAFLFCIAIAVTLEPYRVARILSFLDPWAQMKGSGFQIIQSFVAFSNGGLFGVGLGESKQKLFFLPEAHTDFVLAVIGEEMGLVGVLTIVLSLLGLTALGYKTAFDQPTPYRQFLAFGLSTLLGMEALLNMGVVMGLLPTKGMPLPFVSSGNSSLLVFMVIGGILAKLASHSGPTQSGPTPHPAKT
jgi:cell division protein FtsW